MTRRRWWVRYLARIREAARRKVPRRLRVVTFNMRVGRGDKAALSSVQSLIRDTRPHIIALQEAAGYADALHAVPGYRVHAEKGWPESANCITLIRIDLPSELRPPIRCHTDWNGPKRGKRHPGRTFTIDVVAGILLINVHRTRPGWSGGGRAFAEEYEQLLAVARRHRGPVLIVGDQNIGTRRGRDRDRHTPWMLAHTLGARILTTNPGHIDYAIARGLRGRAKRRGQYGSDHNAVLFTITRPR